MNLCIYGQLGINERFGGILHDQIPPVRPAFGLCCHSAVINQSLDRQYLMYTATQLDLARSLVSWLSFREGNFTQVRSFKVQLFNTEPQTKTAACDFVKSLVLSSTASLDTVDLGVQAAFSTRIPKILFPDYPTNLHSIGQAFHAKGEFDDASECYGSALEVMSGWANHRDEEITADWKRLFYDIFSDRLDALLARGICHPVMERACNNALAWCYEPNLVVDTEKKAKYLFRFAKAKEAWGKPGAAFALLMAALTFAQNKDDLREALRRLRPQVGLSTVNMISTFSGVFASTGNLALTTVEMSQTDLPRDCPICLADFEQGQAVQQVIACEHKYHQVCIEQWLTVGRQTCPSCRRELA